MSQQNSLAPHDRLTFDELQALYSFAQTSDRRELFSKMVIDEVKRKGTAPVVLDIGCGAGMGVGDRKTDFVLRIKQHCGQLWGVEPDPAVQPKAELFDRFEVAVLETCEIEPATVDVAFSHCVMEHVQNPATFFNRLHSILKPGGVYLFLTPNGRSYFVQIAKLLHWLKIDDMVLARLKGKQQVDEYHYPLAYQCNDQATINSYARSAGFKTEFAYYERRGAKSYFPFVLKPALWILNQKRRWMRNPSRLLNLVCRMTKLDVATAPGSPSMESNHLRDWAPPG